MKTAQLLQLEVENLKLLLEKKDSEIEKKDSEIEKKVSKLKQKNDYIEKLEAALIELRKHRYGPRSEKVDPNQLPLFNEAEVLTDSQKKTPKPKKKNKGTRKVLPDDIPSEDKIHDLPDEQKVCPHDGTELKFIGKIKTQDFKFIPAKQIVINHIQYKYACPCCNKHVVLAKKPKKLIPKSISSPELLSYICTSKYADGLPLYRLSMMFKRLGVKLSRQVMANWVIKCSQAIQPLVNMIRDELYNQTCVYIDD